MTTRISPSVAASTPQACSAHFSGIRLACVLVTVAGTSASYAQNTPKASAQATRQYAAANPVLNQAQPGIAAITQPQPAPTAPRVPKAKVAPDAMKLSIDENNIVDLHVNDQDLSAVLEMLSIQSQRNIVASKNVSARVTANLYGVTFYEALEAILNINGYGFIEEGNFIYVYTLDEIAQIEKANRQRVSKVIALSYLSSIDAAEFVKPLLSETGQIKTNGKTAGFPSLGDVPQGNEEYALHSTLVVYDYEENVAEIEALVKQLDTRPEQVLVEATILQTTLNEANAFGVDFAIVGNMAFSDFINVGGPLSGPNALIGGKSGTSPLPADGGGSAISSTVGNTPGSGGLKVGIVSNDVSVFLRVLDEVTDSTVLSNPKLLALNRQGARVLVGRKVGYLSTTSTDTATTQTVEFLDTGTQLYFRPFVDPVQRTIRMELKPQVSEAVIRDVKDATGAAVTIPDEITNELSTNVLVRDGQTIVLGGLFRESTVATRRQIPLLGDIPLIGSAFRGNEDETQRSELIFLITPTIVNDTSMAEAGQRGKDIVDQARAGAREGTLRWSRDRLTSQLNIEAQKLANEGNTEKALWKTERSLSLNSSQPEMIAMREKLTGEKSAWPSRSMLNRIMEQERGVGNRPAASIEQPFISPAVTPQAATDTLTPAATNAAPASSDAAMGTHTPQPQPTATISTDVTSHVTPFQPESVGLAHLATPTTTPPTGNAPTGQTQALLTEAPPGQPGYATAAITTTTQTATTATTDATSIVTPPVSPSTPTGPADTFTSAATTTTHDSPAPQSQEQASAAPYTTIQTDQSTTATTTTQTARVWFGGTSLLGRWLRSPTSAPVQSVTQVKEPEN